MRLAPAYAGGVSDIERSHRRMLAIGPYLYGPTHALLLGWALLVLIVGGVVASWPAAPDGRGPALEDELDQAWRGAAAPGAAALRARFDEARPLGSVEAKLLALEGLEAVAKGDLDAARARVADLDARRVATSAHARALRGALLAAEGDAWEAIDELSRAIDAGLTHPDLRGWRGVALVAAGPGARDRAREVLVDLEAAAAARPLRPAEAEALARASAASPERP